MDKVLQLNITSTFTHSSKALIFVIINTSQQRKSHYNVLIISIQIKKIVSSGYHFMHVIINQCACVVFKKKSREYDGKTMTWN